MISPGAAWRRELEAPFDVRPFDAVIGAEVIGLDVTRAMSRAVGAQLHRVLLAHRLLCFRDQRVTADSLLAFARLFGTTPAPAAICSNADANGRPDGRAIDPARLTWQADTSSGSAPLVATLLYVALVAGSGQWASAVAGYGAATFATLNGIRILGGLLGGFASQRQRAVHA